MSLVWPASRPRPCPTWCTTSRGLPTRRDAGCSGRSTSSASGRTGVIELSVPELRQNYFAELADEVIRAAERRGLGVLVEQTGGDRQREIDVVTRRRPYLTDGLLYAPERLGTEDKDLLTTQFPSVLLGERIFGGPT